MPSAAFATLPGQLGLASVIIQPWLVNYDLLLARQQGTTTVEQQRGE
ncbi:MAG: hypothetical protein ACUVRU_10500 [Anaerolineae bacterium]